MRDTPEHLERLRYYGPLTVLSTAGFAGTLTTDAWVTAWLETVLYNTPLADIAPNNHPRAYQIFGAFYFGTPLIEPLISSTLGMRIGSKALAAIVGSQNRFSNLSPEDAATYARIGGVRVAGVEALGFAVCIAFMMMQVTTKDQTVCASWLNRVACSLLTRNIAPTLGAALSTTGKQTAFETVAATPLSQLTQLAIRPVVCIAIAQTLAAIARSIHPKRSVRSNAKAK